MRPDGGQFIGGFASAHRLSAADLTPDAEAVAAVAAAEARIIAHMNADHTVAMDQLAGSEGWRMAAVDVDGCDLARGEEAVIRIPWAAPVAGCGRGAGRAGAAVGMIDFFEPPTPGSSRPFCRMTRAAGLLFVSGASAPHDPAAGPPSRRYGQPCRSTKPWPPSRRCCRARAAGWTGWRRMTMLLTDTADYDECNAAYVTHFPAGLPARQTALWGVPTEAKVAFGCIALAG